MIGVLPSRTCREPASGRFGIAHPSVPLGARSTGCSIPRVSRRLSQGRYSPPEHDEQRTQAGPYSVWDQIADAAVTPTDQGLLEFHHDAHRDRGSSGFDESVSVLRAKLTARRHEEYRKPPNVPIVA